LLPSLFSLCLQLWLPTHFTWSMWTTTVARRMEYTHLVKLHFQSSLLWMVLGGSTTHWSTLVSTPLSFFLDSV
jgi:hypothetical protein